jgi:hypothetical protein
VEGEKVGTGEEEKRIIMKGQRGRDKEKIVEDYKVKKNNTKGKERIEKEKKKGKCRRVLVRLRCEEKDRIEIKREGESDQATED